MNLLFILAIGAGAYYYMYMMTPPLVPGKKSFTLYYMSGCPHCDRMAPEFAALGPDVNGIIIRKVEANSNDEIEVDGFPTMIYRDEAGHITKYSGRRTKEEMRSFLEARSR